MRPLRPTLTLLAVLGATALAACGGSSSDDTHSAAAAPPASTATATAPAPAPAKSGGDTVDAKIAGFAFAPKDLKVKVGDEITWTNDDSAAHTVTAQSGASFDSGSVAQGASFTFKATKAGTITYFCAIHPSMTGTITVQ